jgi:hypothetical protein
MVRLSPYSLLVVSANGELRRIYCPFKVVCISDADRLIVGQQYEVDRIGLSSLNVLEYMIEFQICDHRNYEVLNWRGRRLPSFSLLQIFLNQAHKIHVYLSFAFSFYFPSMPKTELSIILDYNILYNLLLFTVGTAHI